MQYSFLFACLAVFCVRATPQHHYSYFVRGDHPEPREDRSYQQASAGASGSLQGLADLTFNQAPPLPVEDVVQLQVYGANRMKELASILG